MKALLLRLALLGVPRRLRDSVLGDLTEQRGGAADALAIALHFQAEPYCERADRGRLLLLAVAAAGLVWIVPMAAAALLAQAHVFTDAFSRAALALWGAPHAVAAVASGLLVGGSPLVPPHAQAARVHLVLLLMPLAALTAGSAAEGCVAATLLLVMAALAHRRWRGTQGLA